VGLYSTLYHVCPTSLNFQFDSTFMYFSGTFILLGLYYKRHDAVNNPFLIYIMLAILMIWNFVATITVQPAWYWILTTIFHIIFSSFLVFILFGSMRKYSFSNYFTHVKEFFQNIINRKFSLQLNTMIIVLLLNWITVIGSGVVGTGNLSTIEFGTVVVVMTLINITGYYTYYILQKRKHGEHLPYINIAINIIFLIFMFVGFYYFSINVSDKNLSPELSRELNQPCVLFNFYDYHDIWHFCTAYGLGLLFYSIQFLDEDIMGISKSKIPVF